MQAQPRAHAGFCRNGAVLLPGGSGEDSKVRQAIRRSYQRDHLLRTLSGRRDIHLICCHVVPTGTTQRRDITTVPEVRTIKRRRDVRSATLTNENPAPVVPERPTSILTIDSLTKPQPCLSLSLSLAERFLASTRLVPGNHSSMFQGNTEDRPKAPIIRY